MCHIRSIAIAAFLGSLCGCSTTANRPAQLGTHGDASPHHDDQVTPVLIQDIQGPVGHEVRVATVEYPPLGSTTAHRHPGAIFAYVLSGEVEIQLDNGAIQRYHAGQAWYEHAGQLHSISRNPSTTERAKFVVFFLTEPGEPVLRFDH